MTAKPVEYWGAIHTLDPEAVGAETRIPDLSGAARVSQCASGHTWPVHGRGPCERCGKESSLPTTQHCAHGVPHGGAFGEHNCEYASMRDSLIPFAEVLASGEVPPLRVRSGVATSEALAVAHAKAWSAAFSKYMNILTYLALHGRLP